MQTRRRAPSDNNTVPAEEEAGDEGAEGVKAFSDAKPRVSLSGPLILLAGALGCAWLSGSLWVGAGLVFAVLANTLCDVIVGNILNPPFQDNREPSRGLTATEGKVCPYWPKASVRGPAFMGIDHEEVEFPTANGEILRGWMMYGKRGAPGDEQVLICSHGAGRDRRAWLRHTPSMLARGYSCLAFDFRNHGVSDEAAHVKVGGTSLGMLERDDIIAAVRFVKKLKPKAKIHLVGTSTGAVASILAVAGDKEVRSAVSCIVAENPFATPESVASHTVSAVVFAILICKNNSFAFSLLYPLMRVVKFMAHYKLRWELVRRYGPIAYCSEEIRKVSTPLLLMHGTVDKIVPCEDSEILHGAAGVDAGALGHATPKELWMCPGAEHCQLWDIAPKEFEERVFSFLERF